MSNVDEWTDQIHHGDSFDVLEEIPNESVHAVVSDPPYGLAFMGRSWDDFEPKEYQGWCEQWASKCLEVLKPGGHLLAFSGNRTHHRLFSGVEDAGFEVRDTITWHYGTGFPKALDVAKSIDEQQGEKGHYESDGEETEGNRFVGQRRSENVGINGSEYVTQTNDAEKWNGWKTHLKPATEFVVVARKPFDKTVAENIQEHGTSAMNIDGCRVGSESTTVERQSDSAELGYMGGGSQPATTGCDDGRYPANVAFDSVAAQGLDQDVGDVRGCEPHTISDNGNRDVLDDGGLSSTGDRVEGYDDSGGPSRYFYTSKATKAERTLDGKIDNSHPTVKPQDLMEWLVKLVTAESQIVIDPFCGSGTTCKAAKELNRRFIGIEKQEKWADVSRVRCGLTPNDPSTVRGDDDQSGLEAFGD